MSNPVEPAQYGAGEPNSGGQAFPPPNAGGAYPPPNAAAPGAPGAYPPPGAAGFPPPAPVGPPAAPKKSAGKKVLSVLGVILIALVIFGVKFGLRSALSSDPAADAKVGDCVKTSSKVSDKTEEVSIDMVDCTDSSAQFKIVGRVDGTDNVAGPDCDKFFTEADKDPAAISSPPGADKKYLLCVKAAK